jgi:hypothetical protein
MRLARHEWGRLDDALTKDFTPAQLEKMWTAADEESVARQQGRSTQGIGLSTLSPQERSAVETLQRYADQTWAAAKAAGIVKGEGLPSYTPRMFVNALKGGAGPRTLDQLGRNLKISTPQTKFRKHLTAAETEAAGKAKLGDEAELVRNIRALPLATSKLQEAVAGRTLINRIREIGRSTGEETVAEGAEPTGSEHKWFTLDHPAFKTWRPKLRENPDTGRLEAVKDADGNPVFEKVPVWVRSDFEGPLRAVLTQDSGKIFSALMALKAKSMSVIMYSPAVHNAVEWGRALPAMPGKVATFRIYFEGNAAKNDPAVMRQAIADGLVPIGHRGAMQDITSIANEPDVNPGRSWTAQIVAAIPNIFSRAAGDAVKRTIDRMGDVWHNTLLWDRVGDLQMGLYTNFRDHLIDKGIDEQTASRTAAHLANRYAGALPAESMSTLSRKLANIYFFSRSFTLGNVGAMKDALTGLPRDVQAQIARDKGIETLDTIRSYARRKAIGIIAVDIALMYAANSLLQNAVAYLRGDQSGSDIEQGYLDRLHKLLGRMNEHPFEVLNPFEALQHLSATSENEPGKSERILVGYQKDGTAIYARSPAGKIGEEFIGYLTTPLDMMKRKQSTFLRPLYEAWANDAGFGHKLYNPDPHTIGDRLEIVGRVVANMLSSQTPLDTLESGYRLITGGGTPDERRLDVKKVLGPLTGVTFSKGAPGGPAVGELFAARERHDYEVQQAMPELRELIKNGNEREARDRMKALGIPSGLANYYVRTTLHPEQRLTGRAAEDFKKFGTPEEQAEFARFEAEAAARKRRGQ